MGNTGRKSDSTKARLIEAAGEVFAEQGFRAATVREISRRAEIPLGAMNYHFRNKQGLYAAVIEHSYQRAIRKYPPTFGLRDGATPVDKLRAFIYAFLLRISDKGVPAWHMKLMLQEVAGPGSPLDQVVESSIRPLYKYLVSILGELMAAENPSAAEQSHEIFLCAMSIVGQCCHYYTGRRAIAAFHPEDFDPADIERAADHITRFSLAGIRQSATQTP